MWITTTYFAHCMYVHFANPKSVVVVQQYVYGAKRNSRLPIVCHSLSSVQRTHYTQPDSTQLRLYFVIFALYRSVLSFHNDNVRFAISIAIRKNTFSTMIWYYCLWMFGTKGINYRASQKRIRSLCNATTQNNSS